MSDVKTDRVLPKSLGPTVAMLLAVFDDGGDMRTVEVHDLRGQTDCDVTSTHSSLGGMRREGLISSRRAIFPPTGQSVCYWSRTAWGAEVLAAVRDGRVSARGYAQAVPPPDCDPMVAFVCRTLRLDPQHAIPKMMKMRAGEGVLRLAESRARAGCA